MYIVVYDIYEYQEIILFLREKLHHDALFHLNEQNPTPLTAPSCKILHPFH